MAAAARNLGLTERQIGLRVRKYGIPLDQLRPHAGE
jgi:transcriptional regulator with GAF, ATPase, and Fis domain